MIQPNAGEHLDASSGLDGLSTSLGHLLLGLLLHLLVLLLHYLVVSLLSDKLNVRGA